MVYEVSTPVFDGPFDLLLHLIMKQEVDIYEVSLATIVDAYLAEVGRMEVVDLNRATEFLLIAATLVDLKARRLLPGIGDGEPDEELAIFERRDLLLAQLLACKTYKDTARMFDRMMDLAARSAPRRLGPEEPFASLAPDPLEIVTPKQLQGVALRVFTHKPLPVVDVDHIAPIRASVRDAIDGVLAQLRVSGHITFRQLTAGVHERLELVVRFLAVLELMKRGVVELDQPMSFGELTVRYVSEDEQRDAIDLSDWDDDDDLVGVDADMVNQ